MDDSAGRDPSRGSSPSFHPVQELDLRQDILCPGEKSRRGTQDAAAPDDAQFQKNRSFATQLIK
jgi:hypothetical protein